MMQVLFYVRFIDYNIYNCIQCPGITQILTSAYILSLKIEEKYLHFTSFKNDLVTLVNLILQINFSQ